MPEIDPSLKIVRPIPERTMQLYTETFARLSGGRTEFRHSPLVGLLYVAVDELPYAFPDIGLLDTPTAQAEINARLREVGDDPALELSSLGEAESASLDYIEVNGTKGVHGAITRMKLNDRYDRSVTGNYWFLHEINKLRIELGLQPRGNTRVNHDPRHRFKFGVLYGDAGRAHNLCRLATEQRTDIPLGAVRSGVPEVQPI